MNTKILLVSGRPEDITFWQGVAKAKAWDFQTEEKHPEVIKILKQFPDTLVIWDADASETAKQVEALLNEHARPNRTLAITVPPLSASFHFGKPHVFDHHVVRRYDEHAPFIYTKLVEIILSPDVPNFREFFPPDAVFQEVLLTESQQKHSVIDSFEKFLIDRSVNPRVARIGSAAADELLMNAIFDAPVDAEGNTYRREVDRSASFSLGGSEQVSLSGGYCKDFIGLCVTDQFGSLSKKNIQDLLVRDHANEEYVIPEGEGAGLGLYRMNQQALALLFIERPGKSTSVIAFYENKKFYKDLRYSSCFFSFVSRK